MFKTLRVGIAALAAAAFAGGTAAQTQSGGDHWKARGARACAP